MAYHAKLKRAVLRVTRNGDVWELAGPHNAKKRCALMEIITGRARVPQREAGVTALRAALYAIAIPEGNTGAARAKSFAAWLTS